MICSFKQGLNPDVSVKEHRLGLVVKRSNAMQAHARWAARQARKCIVTQVRMGTSFDIAHDVLYVRNLVKRYNVHPSLLTYAVDCTRQLLGLSLVG